MGIPYIMGFEGALPLGVWKDSDWVLWCCSYNNGNFGAHAENAESDIDPGFDEPGESNDAIPPGGGQKSLKMTAGNGGYREFFSPANLLDTSPAGSGSGPSQLTNGRGLKQVGVRFFWKVPNVRQEGTPMCIRLWDGALGIRYQDTNGTEVNPWSNPLFTMAFNDQGSIGSGFGFEIQEGMGGGNTPQVLESSSITPLYKGEWCQVAMRVGLDANAGFVHIYVDGVLALEYDGPLQFLEPGGNEDPDPAQGIERFSFPHCNADYGGGVVQHWDNFVIYDYWDSVNNQAMDETADLIVQDLVIQGLFPQEEENSSQGSFTKTGVEANFHDCIQGIDNDDSGVIDNIAYNQAGDSLVTTTTMPDQYEVDMWNADRVVEGGNWGANMAGGAPLAIRVVAVVKGVGADAQVSLNAPPGVGASTGINLGPTYTLSNEFSIVQKTWDRNPDGNGVGNPDPFNMAAVNLLKVGLKVDSS